MAMVEARHMRRAGERGVGQGKMRFLEEEFGAGVVIMRAVKKTIDPRTTINPGKIIVLDWFKGRQTGKRTALSVRRVAGRPKKRIIGDNSAPIQG